jgi:CBS domain-containing protein
MKVRDLMTRDVECTRPDATLQEVAERMRSLNVGSLPVCDQDEIVGIITDRDITVRATASAWQPDTTTVRDVMTPQVNYCFEDQDVIEAARLMEAYQIRRLPVLNADRRLTGILALGDLAARMDDEEMAGETLGVVSEPAAPRR